MASASDQILSLVAAMERAKQQHGTDEDEAALAPRRNYTLALEAVMHAHHKDNGGVLDTHDCLLGFAIALGLAIRANTFNKLGASLTLMDLANTITDAAIGDLDALRREAEGGI
jgi:hypothetical protein